MRAICVTMLGVLCLWSVAVAQSTNVLSGRVLDARGTPVAGAQVYYYPNMMLAWFGVPPDSLPHSTTDEKGYYRITNVTHPHAPLSIVVAFHPQLGCSVTRLLAKAPRDLRLQPLKEFSGKVVDTEGKPVVGAQVRLAFVGTGGQDAIIAPPVPPFVSHTDAEGAFRLPAHPQMQGFIVVCTAPGYEPLYYTTNTTWDKLSKEGAKLTLKPGARITARLVYAHNDEPVRGYPVTVYPTYATYTTTDENGRITLDVATGSATLMPGISPSSPTLVPPGFFTWVKVKNLQPGTTTDLGVIKVYTEPVVTVEVRDEKGKTVPFCEVEIMPAADRSARYTPYFTDAKGQLTIPLPDGEYLLNASGPASENIYYSSRGEYRLSVQKGKVVASQPVVLNVTASHMARTQQVKMRVRTSRNQIPKNIWTQFGTVMFEDIEDGQNRWRPYRMEGDTLTVELSTLGRERVDRLIILDAGTQEGAVLRNLSAQNPPKLVRLQPLPRANGRVLDASGKPVVGAKVSLMFGRESVYQIPDGSTQRTWMEFPTPLSTSTDKRGRFALPIVPEGKCWAVVTMKGYEPSAAIVSKGQTATIRLKRASGEYAGVLVDEYGEPVAKVRLALQYQFPDSRTSRNYQQHRVPTREIPLGSVTTDDGGRFTLKGMPSSLLLIPRVQNLPWRQLSVKPSRDLILTISSARPPWEGSREPVTPNVEKLLRGVEWLQPVQWQGRDTLLVITAPYLPQSELLLQTVRQQLRGGWQMAVVLDTTSRQEAERYCQQIGLDVPLGYWKRGATRPIAPVLPYIVPSLPYVVLIGQDGKPQRHGITADELPKLVGALP
ncbi:MAG: carboxypeptidase regulatory-like domain-containing protein [Armatimonadota bacterium]